MYVSDESKQSVFLDVSSLPRWETAGKSICVFRGRLLPRRSASTNMEKESRQNKDELFLNMQTYFTFLEGWWWRQGPGGNLEKLDKRTWCNRLLLLQKVEEFSGNICSCALSEK